MRKGKAKTKNRMNQLAEAVSTGGKAAIMLPRVKRRSVASRALWLFGTSVVQHLRKSIGVDSRYGPLSKMRASSLLGSLVGILVFYCSHQVHRFKLWCVVSLGWRVTMRRDQSSSFAETNIWKAEIFLYFCFVSCILFQRAYAAKLTCECVTPLIALCREITICKCLHSHNHIAVCLILDCFPSSGLCSSIISSKFPVLAQICVRFSW